LTIRFPPLGLLRPALAPFAVLFIAVLLAAAGPALPPSLAALLKVGPYLVLLLGAVIAVWFNRGRAFITLASLLVAYTGYGIALELGPQSFALRAVFTAIAVLVPLNVLIAAVFPERGVTQHRNYRWLLLAAAEVLLVVWIAAAGRSSLSGVAWHAVLDHWLLRSPPAPLAGRVMFALALVAAIARAWPQASSDVRPLDVGLAGALVAFFIACEWASSPAVFAVFVTAAGVVLLVSILQESHRLAFRDELTGLPGRRALEERLSGLGPVYTVAMVDVDHFKQFNDTHGHDVGDQVLKLVATRLAEIDGGGRAFRYGGEEFAVVFDDARLEDAYPHLETMRRSIEQYRMAARGLDRPKDAEAGSKLRAGPATEPPSDKALSVTISIGAAERDGMLTSPGQVVRAADAALYRAKRGGRNRVSR
jgi:GGDEF domain-containing protein